MALHKLKNGTEIDLEAEGLVPHEHVAKIRTEGKAIQTRLEGELSAAQKQVESTQARESLLGARLSLATAAPDERDIKRALAAYKSDIEGVEKPPTFDAWAAGDGAKIVAAIRPTAPVENKVDPAKPETPAKPDAKPTPPNTSASTVPAKTETGMTGQQYEAASRPLLDKYQKARTPEEKSALRKQMDDLDAKFEGGQSTQA